MKIYKCFDAVFDPDPGPGLCPSSSSATAQSSEKSKALQIAEILFAIGN